MLAWLEGQLEGQLLILHCCYFQHVDIYLLCRYPADIYDRIWWPENFKNVERISTSSNVNPATSIFQPPVTVMQSAIIPANRGNYLWFSWPSVNTVFKYYICMYFSEFESEQAETRSREMDIYLNGRFWSEIPPPPYLNTSTHILTATNAQQQHFISINQTENSSLPPILNALEIYQEKEFLQLLTNQQDGIFYMTITFFFPLSFISHNDYDF